MHVHQCSVGRLSSLLLFPLQLLLCRRACRELQKATQLNPSNPQAWNILGLCRWGEKCVELHMCVVDLWGFSIYCVEVEATPMPGTSWGVAGGVRHRANFEHVWTARVLCRFSVDCMDIGYGGGGHLQAWNILGRCRWGAQLRPKSL